MTNALLNIGRLNNFRLNALAPALVTQRQSHGRILLDGVDVRARVRVGSVAIRDAINDAPNTASFTIEPVPTPPYADLVRADGAVAYWRLGDTNQTALDQTGHGHSGVVGGAVTLNQAGAIADGDRAMYFPGLVGSRIDVATAADLELPTGVSVEAWVKTDLAVQYGGIVCRTLGGSTVMYALVQTGASWGFQINLNGVATTVTAPVDPADVGQWVHLVVGWLDAFRLLWIYKNGVLVAAIDVGAGSIVGGAGPVFIGALLATAYPFTGTVDEVAIYPYLSSPPTHYQAGRPAAAATVGQDLRITLGVDAPVVLFSGALIQVTRSYEGRGTAVYHCAATDDTARASRRRPFGQWTNVSATTIARALIATFVPGFGADFVQADLPPVTVIFDGSEGLNRCLTQITNLIGGYWYFLDRQLHLFLSEATDAPDPIDSSHPFLDAGPRLEAAVDTSQVRTRVFGRGHGEALLSAVIPGEPLLPLADVVMFNPLGGRAIALSQVLAYTGCVMGGQGSLVGPGAAPAAAPLLALAVGVGLVSGRYGYAYSNVTASGESLVGPTNAIDVGQTASPISAPLVSAPKAGPGPDAGLHQYAVTFVTGSGETLPGPLVIGSTKIIAAPILAPSVRVTTAAAPTNPESGTYDYVVTFVGDDGGETVQGPTSAAVTIVNSPAHYAASPSGTCAIRAGDYPDPSGWNLGDQVRYSFTVWTAAGESIAAGPTNMVTIVAGPHSPYLCNVDVLLYGASDPAIIARSMYRYVNGALQGRVGHFPASSGYVSSNPLTVQDTGGNAEGHFPPSADAAFVPATSQQQIAVSDIPRGGQQSGQASGEVVGRNLYRRLNGSSGTYRLVATLANNSATTFTDTVPAANLGPVVPNLPGAFLRQLTLTAIPLGDALTVARRIYRTPASNQSTLYLATELADNTTTKWVDTVGDAALGAAAPTTNTATANRVALSAIAVGASIVTARRLYRTTCNGAQLKFLVTIPNNTALVYLDAATDAVLGANPPSSDNSGLTQPQGQVNAGSTSIITASAAPFLASGGWAIIGAQLIRYLSVTGNTLFGIPAAGVGALTATVRYGDHIVAAPMLTGVSVPGGELTAPAGTTIYIWIQRDDVAAQAVMAALDGLDGVYEYLAQDERRGEASLTALCDAHLASYKTPLTTISYATRDGKTRSGKPIHVDVTSPPIQTTLVIQEVSIDQFDIAPGLMPRFAVTASTMRYSFEDLLRQLAGGLEGT